MTTKISRVLQEKFGDPIGRYAGTPMVGVQDEAGADVCPDCGMLPVEGQCGCSGEEASDEWYKTDPPSKTICRGCGGEMSTDSGCGCNRMHEGTEPCSECGMYEVEGSCGCTHMDEGDDLEEVTPPGHEKMVRGLKKNPDIDNPWAVAWAHQKKYGRPGSR
jgi:hypothetical protein